MGAFARASVLALGVLVSAPPAAAATQVVIRATNGAPGGIPTYPGPDGTRIPAGACAAVQGGRVWILPCADPRVAAYQRAAALAAVRQRRVRIAWGGGLLAGLAVAAPAAVLWWRRRHVRPVEVGE